MCFQPKDSKRDVNKIELILRKAKSYVKEISLQPITKRHYVY